MTAFVSQFIQWFHPETFIHLARQTGWLVRARKIDPFEFLLGPVFGQLSALRLTLSAQASHYTQPVSRQAVGDRYNAKAVDYYRAAFGHCLTQSLQHPPAAVQTAVLAEHFAAVYLVDSTGFDCPASLARVYPGCGGAASAANAKVLLRYEYLRGQFEPLAVVPGKTPDQGLGHRVVADWKPGVLQIWDKGFFSLEALRAGTAAGGYFLLPCPRSVSLWLEEFGQRRELDLAATLRRSQQAVVEWAAVSLGTKPSEAVTVRLVAYRLSPESASRQRAGLREAARKQGRIPPAAALELAGWLIVMTNASAERLPTSVLSYFYRVRWQIELVFKQCKSVLRLDQTEAHTNEHRMQCEIWARLMAGIVVFHWHGHLQAAAARAGRGELSFAQVASQLRQRGWALAKALVAGGEELRHWLSETWRHLLRTTRKGRQRSRPTTWQLLEEHWLAAQTT
jgi:hypothetical protein